MTATVNSTPPSSAHPMQPGTSNAQPPASSFNNSACPTINPFPTLSCLKVDAFPKRRWSTCHLVYVPRRLIVAVCLPRFLKLLLNSRIKCLCESLLITLLLPVNYNSHRRGQLRVDIDLDHSAFGLFCPGVGFESENVAIAFKQAGRELPIIRDV